jgi:hypothetical protein
MTPATTEGLVEVPGAELFYRARGTGPVLLTLQGGGGDADGSDALAAGAANMQFFLTQDAPKAHRYQLDLAALRAASAAIVPAAGVLSRDSFPYRSARALAQQLGRPLTEFPGGHSGYVLRPRAFGEALHQALTREAAPSS